jgi:hypothetical protein
VAPLKPRQRELGVTRRGCSGAGSHRSAAERTAVRISAKCGRLTRRGCPAAEASWGTGRCLIVRRRAGGLARGSPGRSGGGRSRGCAVRSPRSAPASLRPRQRRGRPRRRCCYRGRRGSRGRSRPLVERGPVRCCGRDGWTAGGSGLRPSSATAACMLGLGRALLLGPACGLPAQSLCFGRAGGCRGSLLGSPLLPSGAGERGATGSWRETDASAPHGAR